MASCLSVRSAAAPVKILSKSSCLSLHRSLNQHNIHAFQLGPVNGGKPRLLPHFVAAGSTASFLGHTLGVPTGKDCLRAASSKLASVLSAEYSIGQTDSNRFTSKATSLHSQPSTEKSPSSDSAAPEDTPHTPVLLNEVIEHFAGRTLRVFLDGTLGAAGHACAILAAHPELQTFIGLDVDPRAHAEARRKIDVLVSGRQSLGLHLVQSNFENARAVLRSLEGGVAEEGVDGMLLDLGVSSMQVDEAERGFSFLRDGPLDMRMNPGAAVTAEQIVHDWSEDRLGKIIRDYGEERYWRSIARRIAEARTVSRIQTTGELVDLVGGPRPGRRKGGSSRGIHPATRTFQALRIAVNDELGVLERGLPRAIECLVPGGRLAVISFHSLEDRIVKRAFLAAAGRPYLDEADEVAFSSSYLDKEAPKPLVKILTRKPVVPSEEEARANSRSRSAKLRVVEKLY